MQKLAMSSDPETRTKMKKIALRLRQVRLGKPWCRPAAAAAVAAVVAAAAGRGLQIRDGGSSRGGRRTSIAPWVSLDRCGAGTGSWPRATRDRYYRRRLGPSRCRRRPLLGMDGCRRSEKKALMQRADSCRVPTNPRRRRHRWADHCGCWNEKMLGPKRAVGL